MRGEDAASAQLADESGFFVFAECLTVWVPFELCMRAKKKFFFPAESLFSLCCAWNFDVLIIRRKFVLATFHGFTSSTL